MFCTVLWRRSVILRCWKVYCIIYASFQARLLFRKLMIWLFSWMVLNTQVKMKRNCLNIVTALHVLFQNLSSSGMDFSGLRTTCNLSLKEGESCQVWACEAYQLCMWFCLA